MAEYLNRHVAGQAVPDCYSAYQKSHPTEMQQELDLVTKLLCETCKRLPAELVAADPKLESWWDQHRAFDGLRQEISEIEVRRAELIQELQQLSQRQAERQLPPPVADINQRELDFAQIRQRQNGRQKLLAHQ